MKYNPITSTLSGGLGISPERTEELHALMNHAFEALSHAPTATTADIVALLAPNLTNVAEGFYVGWQAHSVLKQK